MRKWLLILLFLLPVSSQAAELDMNEYLFGHISDAYEWHITTINGKEIAIALPCIVIEDGVHVFTLHHAAEHGYTLNADGKLINAQTGRRPLDISITKNVLGLIFDSILLVVLILLCARSFENPCTPLSHPS